jgi:hypothetical protein
MRMFREHEWSIDFIFLYILYIFQINNQLSSRDVT